MSSAQFRAAIGSPPVEGAPVPAVPCDFTGFADDPARLGVGLMLVNDTVWRVDVDTKEVATTWGDRVGDTEAQVIARHPGEIRTEPHPYTGPEGHYLIVTSREDTLQRLIFETDGKQVLNYRAGRRPAVDWIEGCS